MTQWSPSNSICRFWRESWPCCVLLWGLVVFGTLTDAAHGQSSSLAHDSESNVKTERVNDITLRLDDNDPFVVVAALEAAARLGDEIKALIDKVDGSRQRSLELRKEFQVKASAQSDNRNAVAFYEKRITRLDDDIRNLSAARESLAKMADQLSTKADKVRNNPDVKAVLEAEAAQARAKKATEELKRLTPQVLKP